MDEIEYKLESKNPVLISHAVSKLFESIKKKCNDSQENHITKVPEFKLLLSKRDSADPALSISVYQTLIALIENELWDVGTALSTFTGSLSSTKNYVAITTAMTHLLILDFKHEKERQDVYPFTLYVPQHPFIEILSVDKCSWRAILNQMKFIMNHRDQQIRSNSIEMLRPVFLYILCNPSLQSLDGCKQQFWQLLLNSKETFQLQLEVILWLSINEINTCVDTSYRILELAEIAQLTKDAERCTALLPIIASLTIQLLKHGSDPRPNLDRMSSLIDLCDNHAGNITLALMAEVITLCPATYLYNVLQICRMIVNKMFCDGIFLYALVAAILKWMAYPSILCSDALDMARDLINKIVVVIKPRTYNTEISNKIFIAFSHSDPYIQFYIEVLRCLSTLTKDNISLWLSNLSLVPVDLKEKHKLVLSGIFLQSTNPEITELSCKVLVEIAEELKSFGSHVLSLVLHKLTKSRNSAESKCLLLAIPKLITTKENVPIITHTLDTLLNGDKQLRYFAIELYLKTLRKEPRCYRFISTAIIRTMKTDQSWYSDATCARAMRYICENHSEHGEKLVPLLSQILNRCVDTNGSTASALALKSISALCKSAVIGICSTWRVLAPKMEKETRPIVLESLCELFGDIPMYPSMYDEEYDKLITDVVSTLWKFVCSDDVRIIEAALKALASYRLDQIPLKTLPAEFRSDIVLPSSYTKLPGDAAKKPEDVLPYVPGSCWVELLQKVNKMVLSTAGNMLISFISEETRGFRSGIYVWPQGEPHNFKYLYEKSVIRGVGEFLRRCDKSDSSNQRIIVECLRIFAHRYPKPLPNINWSFLEETIGISSEAKEYTLLIACHHATVSLSARSFMENYLSKYKSVTELDPILQSNEYLIPYSSLEDLCEAIQPSCLKPFLETTLHHVIEKINLDNESSIYLFERIMSAYARALKKQDIHDGNSTLLSIILEKLLDKVDLTRSRFTPYFAAVLELSPKHLERMTSPRVWWETTPEKLKNAIAVRAEFALKRRIENPLSWLNEIIDVSATVPSVQAYLLETMQRVQTEMQFEMSSVNWIVEFMTQIQGLVVESSQEDSNKIEFYCNVLFVSIVCLSGVDCMLTRKDLLITSQDVRTRLFSQALAVVSDWQDWKHAIPQIMEWLNYMRTSPMSNTYKSAFHSSLICLRHNPYYKDVWTKYLSIKTVIDI